MNNKLVARAAMFASVFVVGSLGGCSPSYGDAYEKSFAKAQRAYHAGRYAEAAKAFDEAGLVAERVNDRDEAFFLSARMYTKSGGIAEAKAEPEKLIEKSPDGPNRARAAFELAYLEIRNNDEDKGYAMLLAATIAYSKNGLARRSVKLVAAHERDKGGDEAVLAWTKGPAAALKGTEVEENVAFEAAVALENLGRLEEARDAYLALAKTFPYPSGSLFDDALFHASLLEQKLGRNEAAIEHLRTLLAVRETAHLTGSYERPLYSPAQMRIAELYRDVLHDNAAARREFHRFYSSHVTSRNRDDALWEEARLANKDGDEDDACSLVKRLRKEFPESRYSRCARLLCKDIEPSPKEHDCAGYIERAVKPENEPGEGDEQSPTTQPE